MRCPHAPDRDRQGRRAAGEPVLPRLQPVGDIGSDAKRQPAEKRQPGKSGNTDAARSNADTRREQQCADSGRDRDKARRGKCPAPPGHHRPESHCRHERAHDRVERGVEIGWADGDACAADHFQRQRIEGSNQDDHGRRCQQEIIEDQPAFAAEDVEIAAAC